MFFLKLVLLLVVYLIVRMLPRREYVLSLLVMVGVVQGVLAVLQKAGFAESNHPFFDVTGFFGNPGQMGGFQTVTFVAALLLLKWANSRFPRIAIFVGIVLIAFSLVLADSRASLLAAAAGMCVLYCQKVKILFGNRKWLLLPALVCVVVSGILLYLYRSGSVDARLLIWRVSAEMVADAPWFGHGAGGFMDKYMLYQADYFLNNPDSSFVMVADNVAYPYNEALHIFVEYGVVGLLVAVLVLFAICRTARDAASLAPLVAFLLFSMFSYPSYKLGLLVLFPITAGVAGQDLKISGMIRSALCLMFSVLSALSCCYILKIQKEERPLFLDCYPGTITADVIPLLRPTCENWCKIGDYYFEEEDFCTAERYYRTASFMIPTRIMPNYSLWKLYVRQEKLTDAVNMARCILKQPVKVENTYTLKVRAEIGIWLGKCVL